MSMKHIYIDGSPLDEEIIGVGGSGLVVKRGLLAVKIPRLYRYVEPSGSLSPVLLTGTDEWDEVECRIDQIRIEKNIYLRLEGIVTCFDLYSPDPSIQMMMMKSDLRAYLRKERPEMRTALSWLKNMAQTLVHIHNNRVIVADIRLDNFLLDDDLSIKFSDFGESTLLPLDWDMKKPWKDGYSTSIDIGLFGAVMYEILTGEKCEFDLYETWKEPGDPLTWPRRDSLPSIDGLWLGEVIEACWTEGSFKSTDELAAALDKQRID